MNILRWDALSREADAPGFPEDGLDPAIVPLAEELVHPAPDPASSPSSSASQHPSRPPLVEIHDTWEFMSHPENLFCRAAFRDVVLGPWTEDPDATKRRPAGKEEGPTVESDVARLALNDLNAAADGRLPAGPRESPPGGPKPGTTRVRLECRTLRLLPGQRLRVTGGCDALGNWDRGEALAMILDPDSRVWRADVEIPHEDLPARYKYALEGGPSGRNDVLETGPDRVVAPRGWDDDDREASDGASGGEGTREKDAEGVPGDGDLGGAFERGGGSPLDAAGVRVSLEDEDASDSAAAPRIAPRGRARRPRPHAPVRVVNRDGHFRFPQAWRGAGIATPVFSLRSCDSLGAGDFGDLATLVDLAASAGLCVVQILPVNDTTVHNTWWDSYPYSSVSVFALHPLYLRVKPMIEEAEAAAAAEGGGGGAGASESSANTFAALRQEVERARAALDLKEVDYEATMRVKLSVARRCFAETKEVFLRSKPFKAFLSENGGWLKPYATFRALAELFGTAQHWRWGDLSSDNAERTVQRLSQPGSEVYDTVAFHYYVQFHLDKQLRLCADRATRRGVVLKGDLPIGVDKASVDTWMYPDLFRMNTSTGAPPDAFDRNGQNWGFPTYNWDVMSKDGYAWWRARMTHLERYFSAMRIDHVLGFFRIWELPGHAKLGKMGRFRPSVPIRRHELDERGLWFVDRLCDPHVTGALLRTVFGDREGEAAGRFLEETGAHEATADGGVTAVFRFKPEYATEEGLMHSDAFKTREGSPDWLVAETAAMKAGLLELQHNVCLLRDPEDADAFYPRIEMEKTTSFAALEEWARHALSWLSDDYFNRRQDNLWRENARRTLPALTGCTGQLVCGEDLGMVPPCVPPVLEELGILGLRIQRMPRAEDGEFGKPERYPYETVCSPSCHDTTTTRAWYEEDKDRRARFATEALGMTDASAGGLDVSFPPPPAYRVERVEEGSGAAHSHSGGGPATTQRRASVGSVGSDWREETHAHANTPNGNPEHFAGLKKRGGGPGGGHHHPVGAPPEKCVPAVMRAIVRRHMASPSALAVFPAQDLLALAEEYAQRPAREETINDPTNPKHYWRFRLHARLEDLAQNAAWLGDIRQLVGESGRDPEGSGAKAPRF